MKGAKFLLLLFLPLLLCACVAADREEEGVPLYFLSEIPGRTLAPEYRVLPEGEDPIQALLDALLEGPETEDLSRAIPAGTSLRGWSLEGDAVIVDFSSRYSSLSGVALTLADYSIVLTLCQLEEVEAVMVTVNGELLAYRDHQRLTMADAVGFTAEG